MLRTEGPEKVVEIWLAAVPEGLKALKKHLCKIKLLIDLLLKKIFDNMLYNY